MTWSYSGSPALSPRDLVRYLIADTLVDEPLVQDAEIDYQLSVYPDARLAAAAAAEALSRLFARQANTRTPELSVDFAERATQYKALAYQLRQDSAALGAIPYAGGISVSDKATQEGQSDRVAPAFTAALHTDHATGLVDEVGL